MLILDNVRLPVIMRNTDKGGFLRTWSTVQTARPPCHPDSITLCVCACVSVHPISLISLSTLSCWRVWRTAASMRVGESACAPEARILSQTLILAVQPTLRPPNLPPTSESRRDSRMGGGYLRGPLHRMGACLLGWQLWHQNVCGFLRERERGSWSPAWSGCKRSGVPQGWRVGGPGRSWSWG